MFQVSVDDLGAMGFFHGCQDLVEDVDGTRQRQRFGLGQQLCERAASHELGDQIELSTRSTTEIDHAHDVRMVQPTDGLRLLLEE
jgi:hypothetical protein